MLNYNQSNPIITNCIFRDNHAGMSGGGMNNYESNPIINNCCFINNDAYWGGGIINKYSSLYISNCIFYNNISETGGGIDNNRDSHLFMENSIIIGNIATWYGGGLYSLDSSSSLCNNTICNNISAKDGGGIYNREARLYLYNTIIWRNNANGLGNEIYNKDGSSIGSVTELYFCDIEESCSGSGVFNEPLSSTIDYGNNINIYPLFNNSPDFTMITTSDSSTTNIIITNADHFFCIDDVIEIDNNGIIRTVTNLLNDKVSFIPALGNVCKKNTIVNNWGENAIDLVIDVRLQPSSPCIDTGTSTDAPATDILGVARPQGTGVDMGAYEQ